MGERGLKKKLIFFIGGLNFGGMERVVFIAEKLMREQYDTIIVTLYQTDADYKKIDAKIYDLNVPPKEGKVNKAIVFYKRLKQTIKMKRELKPDIIFSFGMYSNYLNALSKKKEKIVMGIRSYDWLNQPFTITAIDKWIVKQFDSVNSVSKKIYEDVDLYWPNIRKGKIIYNPYDLNYIVNQSKLDIDDYIFNSYEFYYITIGRLSYQKAFDHLIKAFSVVNKKVNNSHLIIIGNGKLKDELHKLIKKLDLYGKVELIGGKNNPYKYIAKANAYVLSSYTEGFPNALVESMCIGVPVISVDCKSGPSEILFDNIKDIDWGKQDFVIADYGILAKEMIDELDRCQLSDSERSLAEAMIYCYKHYQEMKIIGKKAQTKVLQFNYDFFKKNLFDELNSLYL